MMTGAQGSIIGASKASRLAEIVTRAEGACGIVMQTDREEGAC